MTRIDYTKYPPGVALAAKIVLGVCPKCGNTGYLRSVTPRYARMVHSVRLERLCPEGGRARWRCVPDDVCRMTRKRWRGYPEIEREKAHGMYWVNGG